MQTASKKPKSAAPVLKTLDFSFILVNCMACVHAKKYSLPPIHEYAPIFQLAKSLMQLPGVTDLWGLSDQDSWSTPHHVNIQNLGSSFGQVHLNSTF